MGTLDARTVLDGEPCQRLAPSPPSTHPSPPAPPHPPSPLPLPMSRLLLSCSAQDSGLVFDQPRCSPRSARQSRPCQGSYHVSGIGSVRPLKAWGSEASTSFSESLVRGSACSGPCLPHHKDWLQVLEPTGLAIDERGGSRRCKHGLKINPSPSHSPSLSLSNCLSTVQCEARYRPICMYRQCGRAVRYCCERVCTVFVIWTRPFLVLETRPPLCVIDYPLHSFSRAKVSIKSLEIWRQLGRQNSSKSARWRGRFSA